MKRSLIRLCTLIMACAVLCTLVPAPALAAMPVERISLNGGMYGQHTETFYVTTHSGWFTSEEVTLQLDSCYIYYDCANRYGIGGCCIVRPAVELKIWRFNFTNAQWELEQNYDVWNDGRHTIELEQEDSVYKIEVYFWNVKTVAASYVRHGVLDNPHGGEVTHAYWRGNGPYIYATGSHDVYLFTQCPITNMQ